MRLQEDQLVLSASDLSVHLGCPHRTQLDRRVALGLLSAPPPDPMRAVLQERGLRHEKAYLDHLRRIGSGDGVDLADAPVAPAGMERTRHAMEAGAAFISQAPLVAGRFRGIADVLLRVERPSPRLGGWSYLAVDTKLASDTRAGTILQLCLYTQIVGELQGLLPEELWVVTPGALASPQRFRTTDYLAFARRVQRQLAAAVDAAPPMEAQAPEPVDDCDVCRWWGRCDRERRDADHLCFVAGISRLQRRELGQLGIGTLSALASAWPPEGTPRRGSKESYERVHQQARVQQESRGARPVVEFLPDPAPSDPEPGGAPPRPLGLARLPAPSPGDVFLDLEGDPFVEGGGREYLFGWVTHGSDGTPVYTARWAVDATSEKAAFEELVDLLLAQWAAHPDFSVHHFGAYEPAALKRLMGRHATRAGELDRLLRAERFVDLHAVVRESLRIGVERYGLKQLEAVHGYERRLDLRTASLYKERFERCLELGIPHEAPEGAAQGVEDYNRDDCLSTWRLRDWLEGKRAERIAAGAQLPRPARGDGTPSEDQEKRSAETQALMDALLDGVPGEAAERSGEEQGRWLLAHLLEWHRREDKAAWWEFFRLADLPPAGLRGEKNGLVGLEFLRRIPDGTRLPTDRYRFAPQDHDVRPGRLLYVSKDLALGTVEAIDLAARTIDVKKRKDTVDLHPEAVFAHERVPAKPLPDALQRLAQAVVASGIDAAGRFRAARDLLLGRSPRLRGGGGGVLARAGESTGASAIRLALDLDQGVLPVQGPPGTGKTYTGARVVCALVRSGQKVGVTGPSHKVIRNFLEEVVKAAADEKLELRILQRVNELSSEPDEHIRESTKSDCLVAALTSGTVDVAAGTVWAWAQEGAEGRVDTLVIDEAGQLSLANALAAATAARNVILLGDPQQLEQPLQGSHPDGCDRSALQHLLGDHDTIPPDRGLFLGTTWRLHPALCAFTSELFYEGRLDCHAQCQHQALVGDTRFAGAGLWLSLVEHQGNSSSSDEEVARIRDLVRDLVRPASSWIDFEGKRRPITYRDLRIVSPYNAQVTSLKLAIPEASEEIGTVDRFQGQEAPVVIYSMTTSTIEDAPRGLEFLFSPNRLNVATSRARCVCILVASPFLFEGECRTPRQMKLMNALCRYRELARLDGAASA